MKFLSKSEKRTGIFGAVVVFVLGLTLLITNSRLGSTLCFCSYDWAHDLSVFSPLQRRSQGILIIYLDESSYRELNQPMDALWNRAIHARLVNRLTADGCKAVVFDVVFSNAGPDPNADAAFAKAISDNGKVVLAADLAEDHTVSDSNLSAYERTLFYPYQPFRNAARKVGFAQLQPDQDFMIREHKHFSLGAQIPSLSWASAEMLNCDVTRFPDNRSKERWINYYGHPGTIPNISYKTAFDMPLGYFRNKVVFIGGRSLTGLLGERRDEFRSPYTTWFRAPVFMPAVEIHATMLSNLLRGDWLKRPPPMVEWGILMIAGWFFGYYLIRFSPKTAILITLLTIGFFTIAIVGLFVFEKWWFPWLNVVLIQAPVGLLVNFSYRSADWYVQRRKLERMRQESETRIREQAALLDKAQDAIIVQEINGPTTYWNPSATRLYGWTAEEVQNQNVIELLSIGTTFAYQEALEIALENGEWKGSVSQTTKFGKPITVESRWTLIRGESGLPKAILAINTDITEKQKLANDLQRAQRVESIGTLANGIAHDLNNVLSPILMSSQILGETEQDESKRRRLQMIELTARKGADMVKQVLMFVRGYQGESSVIQLKHVIREVARIAKETFPEPVRIDVRVVPDLSPVRGDVTRLTQVLLNLCVNARDAMMPSGGTIIIEAENVNVSDAAGDELPPGAYVSVKVIDSGTGIQPEVLGKIFDPFFTTKGPENNSGLGLSTVLGIVKGLHGSVSVSSQPGYGATFTVLLPVASESATEVERSEFVEDLDGHRQKVLVVSRDASLRWIIELVLEQNNYELLQARTIKDACELFEKVDHGIHLVLVDALSPSPETQAIITAIRKTNPSVRFANIAAGNGEEPSLGFPSLSTPLTVTAFLADIHGILNSQAPSTSPNE